MNNKNNKNNKVDFISKFICTIYKKIFYITSALEISLLLETITSIKFNISINILYLTCIIIYISTMLGLYHICKRLKIKQNKLEIKKITAIEKIKTFIYYIIYSMIFMITTPIIHMLLIIAFN